MSNVIDIAQRLERWTESYSIGDISIRSSSHGRLEVSLSDRKTTLSFVEMLRLFYSIAERVSSNHRF